MSEMTRRDSRDSVAPVCARRGLLSMPAVALVWLGAVLAIGLEAWAKFQAPLLTREVGLDVGRTVFAAFNRFEIALALAAALLAVWQRERAAPRVALLLAVVALAVQTLWLLPALDTRATAIIAGVEPAADGSHIGYLIAEGAKVLALAVAAHLALRAPAAVPPATGAVA